MAKIELDGPTRDALSRAIVRRLREEADVEIGLFEAGDLLDALGESLGVVFYNAGLRDAQAVLGARMDTITEAIAALEKPDPPRL